MADQSTFVKRKKRRKAAWIIFSIGFTGCTILGILAFLGRYSGNFTILMNQNDESQLTLFTQFTNPNTGAAADATDKTTFLRCGGLTNAFNYSCDSLPDDAELDSNAGGDADAKGLASLSSQSFVDPETGQTASKQLFLVYTFFVKNVSSANADYSVQMNADFIEPTNGANSLESYTRVRVFENVMTNDKTTETHNMTTYAEAATTPFLDSDLKSRDQECIGYFTQDDTNNVRTPKAKRAENNGFCTNFFSQTTVFSTRFTTAFAKTYPSGLPSGYSVRYTVVMWMEGDDPECKAPSPVGASMTFSMGFQAEKKGVTASSSSGESTSSAS